MGLCKLGVWTVVDFSSRKLFLGHKAILDFPIFYLFQIFWGLLGPIWTPYPKPWCVLCDWNIPDTNFNNKKRKWFSGKIQRCHRWAPGSIPGLRKIVFYFSFSWVCFSLNFVDFADLSDVGFLVHEESFAVTCSTAASRFAASSQKYDLFLHKKKVDLLSHVYISDSAAVFYSKSLGSFLAIENEGTLGSGVGTLC